jgi:ABC-type sugar transport system ATPase subunit
MDVRDNIAWELRNIRKAFGPVIANDGVTLVLRRGQIHGLVGENGSGKSTLIKTLCGAHRPDAGTILRAGKPVHVDNPLVARSLGIATVFQEFSLVPHLTVAENILLGRWPGTALRVDWRAIRASAQRVLADLQIAVPPDALVRDLSAAEQQLVEIAKAMAANANVIVLDEPTAALGAHETEHLHALLRRMRDGGAAILYISHRLDEVVNLADVVTVMRNGRVVSAAGETPLDLSAIVMLMIGRDVHEHYSKTQVEAGDALLEVRDIATKHGVRGATFTLRRGEVLGIGGMLGSGRTEIAHALFGVDPLTRGEILLRGVPVHFHSPADAIAAGIALLTENRKTDGLFFNFNGTANITIANLKAVDRGLWLDLPREHEMSRKLIGQLQVTPEAEADLVERLSGGNQQKILIARWLNTGADVFIFDEPTQGIDVGTKVAIYGLINEITATGKGVLLISSDDKELLAMSDRVAIVRHGRIARIAKASELTKADLLWSSEQRTDAA